MTGCLTSPALLGGAGQVWRAGGWHVQTPQGRCAGQFSEPRCGQGARHRGRGGDLAGTLVPGGLDCRPSRPPHPSRGIIAFPVQALPWHLPLSRGPPWWTAAWVSVPWGSHGKELPQGPLSWADPRPQQGCDPTASLRCRPPGPWVAAHLAWALEPVGPSGVGKSLVLWGPGQGRTLGPPRWTAYCAGGQGHILSPWSLPVCR